MALRILVVSNFYPPIRSGGYAQLCAEVSKALAAIGHRIEVLTSCYQAAGARREAGTHRLLFLENGLEYYSPRHFFLRWRSEDQKNAEIVRDVVRQTGPDVAFVWGMYGLSHTVPASLERLLPDRVVYYVSDLWPASPSFNEAYWRAPARSAAGKVAKAMATPVARCVMHLAGHPKKLEFRHAIVVSAAIRQSLLRAGHPFEQSRVIHSGSNPSEYLYARDYGTLQSRRGPLRLLYAGNLAHHKGVHTILEALALLRPEAEQGLLRLTIIGSGHPQYEQKLKDLIASADLGEWTSMPGKLPSRKMVPAVLRDHDVQILPSIGEDALPRIVQEAMLSALVVVGSDRGGIPEMVADGDTGLLCPAEDPSCLAMQIKRLLGDREMAVTLARNGQRRALDEFSLDAMVDKIDRYLRRYDRG